MESLGEWIHQQNLKFAEEHGIPFVTKPKGAKSTTHKIEIRFVNGPMAQKMREFEKNRRKEE